MSCTLRCLGSHPSRRWPGPGPEPTLRSWHGGSGDPAWCHGSSPGRLWAPHSQLHFHSRGTTRLSPGASLAVACVLCPAGHHCPELGTATPRPCNVGSFSVSVCSKALEWGSPRVRDTGYRPVEWSLHPGPSSRLWKPIDQGDTQRPPQFCWCPPCCWVPHAPPSSEGEAHGA